MMGKKGTKHTPSSLLAHKWERDLCTARYVQGIERKQRNTLLIFLFVHQCTQDCCIVVIFLASSMLLGVHYWHILGLLWCFLESNCKIWLERLFSGTSGFFRFEVQIDFVGFMGTLHFLRSQKRKREIGRPWDCTALGAEDYTPTQKQRNNLLFKADDSRIRRNTCSSWRTQTIFQHGNLCISRSASALWWGGAGSSTARTLTVCYTSPSKGWGTVMGLRSCPCLFASHHLPGMSAFGDS